MKDYIPAAVLNKKMIEPLNRVVLSPFSRHEKKDIC